MNNSSGTLTDGRMSPVETDDDVYVVRDAANISEIVGALNDSNARLVIENVEETPRSTQELAEKCNLSLSTAYRKVDRLSQLGLLREETEIARDGKHVSTYRRRFEAIEITTDGEGFELRLYPYTR